MKAYRALVMARVDHTGKLHRPHFFTPDCPPLHSPGYLLGKRGKRASMKIQQERDQRAKLMAQALESIRLIKSLQVLTRKRPFLLLGPFDSADTLGDGVCCSGSASPSR